MNIHVTGRLSNDLMVENLLRHCDTALKGHQISTKYKPMTVYMSGQHGTLHSHCAFWKLFFFFLAQMGVVIVQNDR